MDSKYLKFLEIQLWETWSKRRSNGTSKVDRQTHAQTDRQTQTHIHIWTNQLIESIGPEGRFIENARPTFNASLVSNPGSKALILVENRGQIFPIVFHLFTTLGIYIYIIKNTFISLCWLPYYIANGGFPNRGILISCLRFSLI